jgi:hypothetical protein
MNPDSNENGHNIHKHTQDNRKRKETDDSSDWAQLKKIKEELKGNTEPSVHVHQELLYPDVMDEVPSSFPDELEEDVNGFEMHEDAPRKTDLEDTDFYNGEFLILFIFRFSGRM